MKEWLLTGAILLILASLAAWWVVTDTDETPCEHDARLIREGQVSWAGEIGDLDTFADAFLKACEEEEGQDDGH